MNENFGTLFLDSLKDGTYNTGLKEKIDSIRMSVHHAQESDGVEWANNSQYPSDISAQNAKEIANNIVYDSTLSQSYGNPSWYPPVPTYTIPEGKTYTPTEIAKIKMSRDIEFIQQNIVVGMRSLSSENIDNELLRLTGIDPYILSRTIIHTNNIDVITRHIPTPSGMIREVTSCVGYMVNIYVDARTNNVYLSNIYVYSDNKAIDSLLSFLRDLRVENMDDLRNSWEFFVNLLPNK